MKILASTLLAGLLAMGSASAQVVTFDFTGKVDSMFEYDGTTITTVQSSALSGVDIANGDSVHGRFSYDLSTPLSTIYQPSQPAGGSNLLYEGPQHPLQAMITFEQPAYTFTADSSGFSQIYVANNTSPSDNGDMFTLSANAFTPGITQTRSLHFHFFDFSGNTITGPSIPGSLSLPAFNYAAVSYSWSRVSDGKQFHATALISSLTPGVTSPVPEPSTYAMFAVGLLALGAIARRKAAAQR
jgi:hypothetical protein